MPPASPLEAAERHVRQAEARIARQQVLRARLNREGRNSADAVLVLTTMEETLRLMRTHLRIEQEQASQRANRV